MCQIPKFFFFPNSPPVSSSSPNQETSVTSPETGILVYPLSRRSVDHNNMGEADDAKKRRLPSWMMSSSSSIDIDNNNKSKKKKKESNSNSIIDEEEELPVVKRGTTNKQAGRKTVAKKPKTQTRRRPRRRHYSSSDDEEEDPITFDDDEGEEEVELTADDLITIAKEYVKADDARAKQNEATAEPKSRNTTSSASRKEKLPVVTPEPNSGEQIDTTSLTSINISGSSMFDSEVLPTLSSLGLPSNWDNIKDREYFSTEGTDYSSYKTGDSTQDMLDLFLGPLLNMPKKTESTKLEAVQEEIAFDYGLEKPRQKEETVKQPPPLTKKKTSLRDRVAMFLD